MYFSSQLQRFQSMVVWLHCFWVCYGAVYHGRGHDGAKPFTSWWMRGRERREGSGKMIHPSRARQPGPAPYSFHQLFWDHSIMNLSTESSVDEIKAHMILSLPKWPTSGPCPLGTKPSTHDPLGVITDPNYNTHIQKQGTPKKPKYYTYYFSSIVLLE